MLARFIAVILLHVSFVDCQEAIAQIEPTETEVVSPDRQIRMRLSTSEQGQVFYSVDYQGAPVLLNSRLGLALQDAPALIDSLTIVDSTARSCDETWKPVLGERSTIRDHYNELLVELTDGSEPPRRLNIRLRAYNEGVALCYSLPRQPALDDFTITDELTEFRFADNHYCWASEKVEGPYSHLPINAIEGSRGRPLVVEIKDGPHVALGEARMVDYSRMRFEKSSHQPSTLVADLGGHVSARAPFDSPWRYLIVADTPGGLIEQNDLVRNLNDPCAIADTSWIKPGKCFRSNLTTTAAKASIDHAAKMNFQYLLLDAGWYGHEHSDSSDATTVTVDPKRGGGPLDLPEVIRYAREKQLGVFLYVNRRALQKQLDELLPLFQDWGVAGIKFGFVNVGSQKWTTWLHEAIRKCADHKLLVDVHDSYLPTGWSRTYPNLLTQEGIRGNEQMPTAEHNATLPFVRFLCGAGDYTVCYFSSRIQTTRAHQLAASIVYFSPLQLLFWYDKPEQYDNEPELELFKQLHTTWDDTRVIHGKIGQYVTIARRKGDQWFVGTLNAVEQRQLEIPLSFLDDDKSYAASIHSDTHPGKDSPKLVSTQEQQVTSESTLIAEMAANGGHAIVLTPR